MTAHDKRPALKFLTALYYPKQSGCVRPIAAIIAQKLCLGLLASSFTFCQLASADDAAQIFNPISPLPVHQDTEALYAIDSQPVASYQPQRANFEQEYASKDARQVADWVVDSGDNHGKPFVIIDKKDAKVFVFTANGLLRGAAPALLGLSHGDDSVPGIGDKKLSDIRPVDRTTPAGRFVADLGHDTHGKDILWVDYDNGIALHRVVTSNPKEHRAERLSTATPLDNRISYGCINVPVKFYENIVSPSFTNSNGIVYVLPETRSPRAVFSLYDVDERARLQPASQPVHIVVSLPHP